MSVFFRDQPNRRYGSRKPAQAAADVTIADTTHQPLLPTRRVAAATLGMQRPIVLHGDSCAVQADTQKR